MPQTLQLQCQQNIKTKYFKHWSLGLLQLPLFKMVIQVHILLSGNMQMLQFFNEFALLMHVGILDDSLKKIQGVCWTKKNFT